MGGMADNHGGSLSLSDEALEWIVRLNSGRAGEDDHARYAAWRETSAEHEEAAKEAEALWESLGAAGDRARRRPDSGLGRRSFMGLAAFAVTGGALYGSGIIPAFPFADYRTAIGERRSVELPDGSIAHLNADSAIVLDFSDQSRRLRLRQGQATFSVTHDPAKPFVVEALNGSTRAIGTVFDVDVRLGHVDITVLEGQVAVAHEQSPGSEVLASGDQRVRYGQDLAPSAPQPVEAETEIAWRRGKLIFDRRPLGDVVADIERYRRGRILVASSKLRALEVTGVFDLDDPEAILSAIESSLSLDVWRLPFVTIIG